MQCDGGVMVKITMEENIPIIILSDDDDEESMTLNDSSVLFVENEEKQTEISKHIEQVDEDLAITYTQTGTVLPHARYDCTLPFNRAEQDVFGPLQENAKHCEQCFCYICDQPASMCQFWILPGICHCNAHKHSVYWKTLRDKSLMGYLHEINFTFDPLDMDSDLRNAETSLKNFAGSLSLKYAKFLMGCDNSKRPLSCRCTCHRTNNGTTSVTGCKGCQTHHLKFLQYDYTSVSQHIQMFLQEAAKQNPKACIVMLLGAAKLFINHTAPGSTHAALAVSDTVSMLLWRVMTKVWKILVDCEFSYSFKKQLQLFYQRLPLPSNSTLPRSLNVLPWDDPLLTAVMKGQNVTGERHVKGRRAEILSEPVGVIQARVCKLQQNKKYRELARYLKLVKCFSSPTLEKLRDLIPLYLCKVGEYIGAVNAMLSPMPGTACPASRLTPAQFRGFLRVLVSGHAPVIKNQQADSGTVNMIVPDHLLATEWTPIEGSNLLKLMEVLKFALRVLDCNTAVFADSESWMYLLSVISSSHISPDGLVVAAFYAEPDLSFQMVTRSLSSAILEELSSTSRLQIPKAFENGYPDQARLMLATQALVLRIFHSKLTPILAVIFAFRFNRWALRWLFCGLLVRPEVLHFVMCSVLDELCQKQCQSKWGEAEHSLISYFLCLYFLDNNVVLTGSTYAIQKLLAVWNEVRYPWQTSFRVHLECSVANLNNEKLQILQQLQHISHVPTS
nr:uncharacterized protein zgc:112980 isoform X1 [Misgurnus anguillicaudatus]